MKKVYLFDENTGAYSGEYLAQENPVNPGDFLKPTFSTTIKPVIEAGFWPVFTDNAWVNFEDHRGATVYDTTTGLPEIIAELGTIPTGKTLEPKPADYYTWNGSAWVEDVDLKRAVTSTPAWAIRRALTQMGLRDATEQAVAAADQDTKDMWEYATTYHRISQFTLAIAAALNKTDSDLDQLFTIANQIEAENNGY